MVDTEFLQSRGFEILRTPESDERVTVDSFIFIPFGDPSPIVSSIHAAHPSLLISTDLSGHRWWHILDESTEIPSKAPLQRECLLKFLERRVAKRLPKSDKLGWLGSHYIYFKPVSDGELAPVGFDVSDDNLFPMVKEEARALWEQRILNGDDLSANRRDESWWEGLCDESEEEDEWPVPGLGRTNWKEKIKGLLKG